MKRSLFITLIALMLGITAQAADATRYRIGLNFQFTSYSTWQVDFSCHYMVQPWLGLGGSIGGWRQYGKWPSPEGPDWWVLESDRHASNVFLRPSVLLMTPTLFNIGKTKWGLTLCPGVQLNVPHQRVTIERAEHWDYADNIHVSTTKGQWAAVDCRAGVWMKAGPVYILAGYVISSLDIYGMYRHLAYDKVDFSQYYPKRKGLQGGYVTFSYNF